MDTSTDRDVASKKRKAPVKQERLLTYRELPEKGIRYTMGRLRIMWQSSPPLFPPPIRLSPKKLVWLESTLDRWIAERIASAR
jgi:predicted DNA-binding transcriptional regulator AlpA